MFKLFWPLSDDQQAEAEEKEVCSVEATSGPHEDEAVQPATTPASDLATLWTSHGTIHEPIGGVFVG